jgi:hypothetical protein
LVIRTILGSSLKDYLCYENSVLEKEVGEKSYEKMLTIALKKSTPRVKFEG